MLKKFFIFLAVLLAVALILCWIYLPSVTRYRELRSEEERLKQKIREIDQQIKVLADERNLLQTDVAYLEKVIREELGFVKPGEIIYELVTKTDAFGPTEVSLGTSVTSDSAKTSVTTSATSKKTSLSPAAAVASVANTTPKIPKKKSASS
ncbi:MAG TPA: septum formation initiator family protein [Candidatus Omnitrophota bacterium]|nr:septum formation initiator family protein [Candidatus Omnitrophota bacterium]